VVRLFFVTAVLVVDNQVEAHLLTRLRNAPVFEQGKGNTRL
jgi:hypothetical protein